MLVSSGAAVWHAVGSARLTMLSDTYSKYAEKLQRLIQGC